MRFDTPAGKPAASLNFGQPFEEAIAAARARGVELPEDYYARIPGEMRRAATTVSGLAGLDQIQAVVDSFEAVLTGEQTLAEWVAWALLQNWGLSKGRMETVLRTNVQTAYGTGSWRSFERNKKTQPYLMWSAIDDSRVRPSHLAMDGYIAPVDDPIWRVWHPPAGWNCRCSQLALTEKQAIARGYGKQAKPTVQPDPGFGNADDGVTGGLRDAIQTRKAVCETGGKAIWCSGEGAQALARVERELDPE